MTQTFIYAIYNKNKNEVKIGYATNPTSRLSQLQTGTTDQLKLLFTFCGGITEEKSLHQKLAGYRLTGEWFIYNEIVAQTLITALNAGLPTNNDIKPEDPIKSVFSITLQDWLKSNSKKYKTAKQTRVTNHAQS
jgi:hypothetical protein